MDFHLYFDGSSIFLLTPVTEAAINWSDAHLPQDAPMLGNAVAVEHRYISAIVAGIESDGLSVAA